MTQYNEPSDEEVAAYWPINFPLKRKWRNAIQHVAVMQWCGGFSTAPTLVTDGDANDGVEQTIDTLDLYIPAAATGLTSPAATGTTIQLRIYGTLSTDANATSATASIGIRTGGVFDLATELGVVAPSSTDTAEATRAIGLNLTADTITTVEIYSTITVTGATGVATLTLDIRDEDPCFVRTVVS